MDRLNLKEFDKIITSERKRPFKTSDTTPRLLYHYRSKDSFWLILKSDSFWATEVGFSNDAAERSFGRRLRDELWKKDSDKSKEHETSKDERGETSAEFVEHESRCIVCLSADGDLLSQWRGYAPNGGVSLGLDFGATIPFTVFPKPDESKNGYIGNETDSIVCYISPLEVKYYIEDEKLDVVQEDIAFEGMPESEKAIFESMLPFVKHRGFWEEQEWRLVIEAEDFDSDADGKKFKKLINYRNDGERQIPFICVKPGNYSYEQMTCCVRTRIRKNAEKLSISNLYDEINKALPEVRFRVFSCESENEAETGFDDKSCFGCTRRRRDHGTGELEFPNLLTRCCYSYEESNVNIEKWDNNGYEGKPDKESAEHKLYIPACNGEPDSIIISQGKYQDEIFNAVYEYTRTVDKTVKVWCEGHLPIREIIVSPCANQNEMVASIKHYCLYSEQYWLKCVDVIPSKIPYRTPLFTE